MRLRLALLRGSLRSGSGAAGRRVGLLLGALAGGLMALGALSVMAAARGYGRLPEDLATLLFTMLLLGWVVLPVLTFGSDDLLDPARLALLPLTRRQLLTVMGVGALVGVAPAATTVAALGLLPATGSSPASYVVALLAVALLLGLCVSASRATGAALSGLLRSRRGRDVGVALAALVGLGFQLVSPLLQLGVGGNARGGDVLKRLADPLRWTPPGLLAAAPGRSLPGALASLLAVAAVVGMVLLLWERSVRRALERPDSTGSRRRRSTALLPRRLPLPAGRTGAVAAKDLRYLVREPRRLIGTVLGVFVPVVAVVFGPAALSGDRPPEASLLFALCGIGLLGGLAGANRFGLDGSAIWLLISTATDRRDPRRDLVGADLATAVVIVPVLVVVGGVLAAVSGGWAYLAPAIGVAVALFTVVVSLSGLIAVNAPFAVPHSENAFSTGSAGQGCASGALTLGALLAGAVVCLPLLGLLLPALLSTQRYIWGLALLLVGPAYGMAVAAGLRAIASRRWAGRSTEVLRVMVDARA